MSFLFVGVDGLILLSSIDANYWINHLNLQPHPEGGYFHRTYCSQLIIPKQGLPENFNKDHVASTAIYYLLQGDQFSAFHRIKSDEMWHFYDGSTLLVHSIDKSGELITLRLGRDAEKGDSFQGVKYAGTWFAAELEEKNEKNFALVGCTVSPGFYFEDFELSSRTDLTSQYPQHRDLINKLTRS